MLLLGSIIMKNGKGVVVLILLRFGRYHFIILLLVLVFKQNRCCFENIEHDLIGIRLLYRPMISTAFRLDQGNRCLRFVPLKKLPF